MELTAVGIAFSAAHLGAVYLGTDVFRLEYANIMALNIGFAVVMSLLTRASMPTWKPKVEALLKRESREGDAFLDLSGMFLAFIVGGVLSALLLYRRYGAVGWLGVIGSSALVNWLV